MANPQKENGFTPIANELIDALSRTKFTELETQALFLIFRNTYGYQRKEWQIKKWKVFENIGIHKCNVKYTLQKLSERKIINLDWKNKSISFQKDYTLWQSPISRKSIRNKVSQSANFEVSQVTNKEVSQVTNKKLVNLPTQISQVTNSTPPRPTDTNAPQDPKENLKERKKDYKETSSNTSEVHSTINPAKNKKNDSSLISDKKNTDPLWQGRDASGRWHPPAELAKEGDNGKKPPKPPDMESNFEFIASQPRDVQLVLLKRLTEEKKAEFYEWVKSQNKEIQNEI